MTCWHTSPYQEGRCWWSDLDSTGSVPPRKGALNRYSDDVAPWRSWGGNPLVISSARSLHQPAPSPRCIPFSTASTGMVKETACTRCPTHPPFLSSQHVFTSMHTMIQGGVRVTARNSVRKIPQMHAGFEAVPSPRIQASLPPPNNATPHTHTHMPIQHT